MFDDFEPKTEEPKVEYKNNPTVCCVLLPWADMKLVLIRRGLKDGYGKLALPGGFQNFGEDIRVAACREVLEETGVVIKPDALILIDIETDEFGHNVAFFQHCGEIDLNQPFNPKNDGEVLEVVVVDQPVDTAYPFHTKAVSRYFDSLRF